MPSEPGMFGRGGTGFDPDALGHGGMPPRGMHGRGEYGGMHGLGEDRPPMEEGVACTAGAINNDHEIKAKKDEIKGTKLMYLQNKTNNVLEIGSATGKVTINPG